MMASKAQYNNSLFSSLKSSFVVAISAELLVLLYSSVQCYPCQIGIWVKPEFDIVKKVWLYICSVYFLMIFLYFF